MCLEKFLNLEHRFMQNPAKISGEIKRIVQGFYTVKTPSYAQRTKYLFSCFQFDFQIYLML